ncbi:hypothetical protein [Ligilactobacillus murinus]|uniref:Uncharacterized protein n=1 Tax=Ligilactobacillus murinus TaxID=1622 RepID=A0AAE7BS28_9LACO|nr:hypothetical protein [Ligilactobacillus murinus]NEF83775.1 hypothetical protein [Ligilactobacillus murinus]NEF86049.1 hypothetical protein [Ligilactobacillus murinus]NEF88354.1 hypothetical protein [Ligilactobacillus murinus]NEF90619.1 hypothetical protein [Ligilactobacillus murinus]NEF92882.1 hypothetical protein [Ligilactobacillus murinus]
MSKTKQTLEIEQALIKRTSDLLGCYGALEVTIGRAGPSGYERCDYVEFDTSGEIRCYEIKVTMSDLKSKNKLSYLGDKNYLVVPAELADKILNNHYNLGGVGLIAFDGKSFKSLTRASKRNVSIGERVELLEGIAKSACRGASKYYLDR